MWIDRAKAVVVCLEHEKVTTRTLQSGAGKKPRVKGGARSVTPWGPQDATNEGRRERNYEQHVKEYYDQIVSAASGADEVFIIPSDARHW